MRWKLLLISSVVAAIIGLGLWSALTIAFFGSARALARHDLLLLVSLAVPLGLGAIAAVFAYRHTARRRKTQAVITVLLVLFFSTGIYLVASQLFPERLIIPRTYEVRHGR